MIKHIADKAGKLVNRYSYDAFGNIVESAESLYNLTKHAADNANGRSFRLTDIDNVIANYHQEYYSYLKSSLYVF